MPTTQDMNAQTISIDSLGLAATINNTQDKVSLLTNKVQEKVNTLAGKWEPAMIESFPDADSPQVVGITGSKGKGGDLTGQLTEDRDPGFDAYERAHPNDPYRNTSSAEMKYERQRQRLETDPEFAAKIGVKDIKNITDDDIARAGTWEQLMGLYNAIPGTKAAWEPGPLDYYDRNRGLELGSKNNPLNIPIERRDTGEIDYFGRHLAEIRNKDTGVTTKRALGYDGTEDVGYSAAKAKASLATQGKLTPELAAYLDKNEKYVTNPTAQAQQSTVTKTPMYSEDEFTKKWEEVEAKNGRSWGDAASDTGKQVVVGSLNAVKNLADIYGVATGDHDNWVSQTMGDAAKWYGESYSPALKAAAEHKGSEVAKGKDELEKFWIATKENFKNPMLISQLVVESAPMMAVALAGGEAMAAAKLGIGATEGMLAVGAVQQGADMGDGVYQSFFDPMKVTQKDWDNNETYKTYVKQGMSSQDAKEKIASDTSRVVALASGLLSYGVNRYMPGGHSIESRLTGGKVGGLLKSTAGESATEVVEEGGGQIFQNLGQQQVTPGLDTFANVGQVSADAMAAGGATNVAIQGPGALASGKQALGEKYDNLMDNLDDGENGKESITPEGRKNRWESALDVDVAPENRAAYTRDLARYTAEEFVRSGDLKGEYAKEPSKLLDDAVERISKINEISSEEGKDLIGRQLAKQVYDRTQDVDTKGNRAFSEEKGKEILSSFVGLMKGNKGVEDTLEREFEKELEGKFEEARARLAQEGVDTKDLSNKGVLTQSELDNLVKTLDSMKVLGSERLKNRAEDIQEQLEARQARLGSENELGGTAPVKKDFATVRNEIETLGFLTKGKKSLQQHARDLDAYVVDSTADRFDKQRTLNTLEAFVDSRNAKINVADRKAGKETRFRSVGELKNFAKETYTDNEKIMKVIEDAMSKLEDTPERTRLEGMAEKLTEVQSRLGEVVNEGGTVDQDKELLRKVGSWGKFTSEAELEAFKDYVDNYKKIGNEEVEEKPTEELTVEVEEKKEVSKPAQLEEAIQVVDDYSKELKELLGKKDSLIAQKVAVRNMINDQLKELDKMNIQAKRLDATIKSMESRTVDEKLEIIISDLVRRILQGVRLLKGKLQKLLDRISKKTAEKEVNEATENRLTKEIQEVIDAISRLEDKLEGKEKAAEEKPVEATREFRNDIEEVVSDSTSENKSNRSSLTTRLFNGLDVMDMMPRIIRESETGKAKVEKALETLKTFEDARNRPLIVQDTGADNAVLEKLGLDKLFSDKSIEEKVKKAMHVSSMVAFSDMVDARRIKGEQLDQFVDGAFGNLWSKYAEDRPEEKQLKNIISSGKIVPISTFTRNAGRRLLEELEIKLDTDTMQDYDDAVNALGAIVVNNVLWKDSKMAQVAKGSLALKDGKVVVKSGFNKDVYLGEGNVINVLDMSKLTAEMVKEISDAGMVFEYAKEQSDGMISLKPITHKEDKAGRNTDVRIGKAAEKYLNEQGSKPWKFDKSFVTLWEAIGKDVNVLKEMILGTKEELVANTEAMEVESAMAKYVADELDVERMMMAYELVGDKEFYLGWDYTVSNRNMISNKMINPQNSKISRFVVGMEGMRHKLEISDGERIMLEHAILQAFDGDPDKKSDDEVRKALKVKGVELNIIRGKYEVTLSDKIQKLLDRGTVVSLQGIKKELGIHGAHLMHMYQALTMLKELRVNGKDVQTNLAVEADGITNGMATTTLQMGLQAGTADYYSKSGLYIDGLDKVNGKKVSSHGEFKEAEGKDFYETPVDEVRYELGDKAEIVEKVIGGKWRSYLKPLVMVYAYGASMKNITRNGSIDLVLKVLNNKNLSIEEVHKQLEELGVSNAKAAYKAGWKVSGDGRLVVNRDPRAKTAYVDNTTLEVMAKEVEGVIGSALAKGFDSVFRPVTEYRRALKVVNQLSYLVFRNELDKELKELGVSRIGQLSKKQMTTLTQKMVKDGTWYGSDTALGTTQDYFKTQQALGTSGETITVKLPTKWGEYSNGTGYPAIMNKIVKEAASNVGAVGVVDVHSIDGTTMIKGHVTDVLNIFDALVMSTNYKLNKEQMEAINQAYIDINMNHSILGKAVEKLLKNGDKLKEITSIKGQLGVDMLADMKRIFAIGSKDNFVEKLVKGMDGVMDTLLEVDEGRRELVEKKIDVKQYYISDELGGGKWDGNKPEGRFAVFNNDKEIARAEQERLGMMLEKLKNVALGLEVKRKEKSAIINKKEKVNNSMAVTATNRRLEPSYHESMNKLVKEIVGPNITESEFLGLSKATLDNIAIVGGQYTKGKIAISKTPNMDMMRAQLEGVFDDWYINNAEYSKYQGMDEESLREVLNKDEAYNKIKDPLIEDMLKEAVVKFANVNGAHTLAHEMVHAGSVEFMENNPNHKYTKRIEELYDLAINNKESILHHMGVGANEYWTTNKEEFVAEGLSNPDLVYALTNIKVEGKPRMFNLFREMLETLCKMVGVAKNDSAYEYLLDGYLAMLHSQVPQTVEGAKRLDMIHQQMQDVYTKSSMNSLKEKLSC